MSNHRSLLAGVKFKMAAMVNFIPSRDQKEANRLFLEGTRLLEEAMVVLDKELAKAKEVHPDYVTMDSYQQLLGELKAKEKANKMLEAELIRSEETNQRLRIANYQVKLNHGRLKKVVKKLSGAVNKLL